MIDTLNGRKNVVVDADADIYEERYEEGEKTEDRFIIIYNIP